jgi:hypothetical protein
MHTHTCGHGHISIFIVCFILIAIYNARFEVLTVILLKKQILWDVTLDCWVSGYQHFPVFQLKTNSPEVP